MLIFEQFHTPGIAQLSYLIGDDSKGVAAVIDPRPDVDCYLEKAREMTARHFFVPDLCENLDKFDRNKPVVAYCDSGYRASLASSILKLQGFETVYNVPGSWQAWTHAGYPIEGKMN